MLTKRRKIEINLFDQMPDHIIYNIFNYMTINDLKSFSIVNSWCNTKVSQFLKKRTYLYIINKKNNEVPKVLREFSEIFIHGTIDKIYIENILKEFTNKPQKLSFGKNDLTFIKLDQLKMINWLDNVKDSLKVLNTLNIEIIEGEETDARITLQNLQKLRCCDTLLRLIDAPNLEDIHIYTKDDLTTKNLQSINNFLIRHHSIKKFTFRMFCGEDIDVLNVDFKLSHLKLTHFRIADFRHNPKAVLEILKNQTQLEYLYIVDGFLTHDDLIYGRLFEPIFDELLNLKQLEKIVIEMPSVKLIHILKKLPMLKRLHLNAITFDVLDVIKATQFPNLKKLCLEGIDFGKSSLSIGDVWMIGRNYKNVSTFKFDLSPLSVVNSILNSMERLKVIKIIKNQNKDLMRKVKAKENDLVKLPQTSLEKIICDQNDFKLRILPIIRVSPRLKHVKILWNDKNTPFMTIIIAILEVCSQITIIEFKYNEIFAKDDLIPFKSHFTFSYNNRNFQIIICRKNGNIKCCKC